MTDFDECWKTKARVVQPKYKESSLLRERTRQFLVMHGEEMQRDIINKMFGLTSKESYAEKYVEAKVVLPKEE